MAELDEFRRRVEIGISKANKAKLINKVTELSLTSIFHERIGISDLVEARETILGLLPDSDEGQIARGVVDRISEAPAGVVTPEQILWVTIGAVGYVLSEENFNSNSE